MHVSFPWPEAKSYLIALFATFFLSLVFLALKRWGWRHLIRLTSATPVNWDDALLAATSLPLNLLLIVSAFAIGINLAPAHLRHDTAIIIATKILFILSGMWLLNRAIVVLVNDVQFRGKVHDTTRTLLVTISRVVIASIAVLIVLDTLGISITPILASLGVGSVAVALALQDTLSNFFSGIYLLIDQPIRLEDFIELDNHVQGVVKKIGWRSTHIQMLSNNMIVIPNSKLSSTILTNYHMPERETSVSVQVGVAYESDLDKVERVTIEVAKEVMARTDGAVPGYQPSIRFHTLNQSSIDFSVNLRALSYTDNYLLKHEFIKALQKRYTAEGISIPFPQQVVHLVNENRPN